MTRLQAFLGGVCMLALALGPGLEGLARAQPMPENNPQACHDGYDNDGNGYVDCSDPQCQPFCQQQYAPPPQQYAPPPQYPQQPPPQYYAPPPPPPYYAPPPRFNYAANIPPPTGLGQLIAGSILLPLGIIFIAVSVPLWNDACNVQFGCVDALSPGYAEAMGALWLDVVGVVFVIAGLVLIPIGAARYGRYRRWRATHPYATLFENNKVRIDAVAGSLTPPTASGAASITSSSIGLKFSF